MIEKQNLLFELYCFSLKDKNKKQEDQSSKK